VPVVATLSRLYDLDSAQGQARRTRKESAGITCRPQRQGATRPHATAERGHRLRIEPAQMHEFCAYNENCKGPGLVAQIGSGRGSVAVIRPLSVTSA
jgi:hypothetical protein